MDDKSQKKWLDWIPIQDNYLSVTIELLNSISDDIAFEICNDVDHSYLFLRSLLGVITNQDYIKKFEKTIVFLALEGNATQIILSKTLIYSLDSAWKENNLFQLIVSYLSNIQDKEDEYFIFRNAAQILKELNRAESLQIFLKTYCFNSENIDIKEIYEDFNPLP